MTLPDVAVVIPIGPGHEAVAETAIASARAQTVPVDVITVYDTERRGPGWARNRGLEQVRGEWVVFLDADDLLDPRFVERALSSARPGRYVYTGWYEDGQPKAPPERPWCGGTWHVVTALLPVALVRAVGGFDEHLPGAEDTDFFLKIATRRLCGIRVPDALMHYTNSGEARSKRFKESSEHNAVMAEITRRYSGKMGCCGDIQVEEVPAGEKLPGDVLAMALWGGNRRQVGTASGRHYPRTGNGKQVWIDPRDALARPDLWQIVDEPAVDDVPALEGVAGIAGAFIAGWKIEPAKTVEPVAEPVVIPALQAAPDVVGLLARAQKAF